jgi:hypothetical protein
MNLSRDYLSKVVLNLRTEISPGKFIIGTGIFISKSNTDPYILTANHIAITCTTNTKVILSGVDGSCVELSLTEFNTSLSWKHHSIADISILKIIPSTTNAPHIQGRCFPLDHFHIDKTSVSKDTELTSVGFPNGLGSFGKFSPLTFRSFASSSFITLNRFDLKTPCDFFLLENPSIGGYSGGPIFDLGYRIVGAMTTSTGITKCYGIMHGTISDDTGGKIAAVTPAYYLMDII